MKLPPKQKKWGRPKGSELTVIGLPKKKRKDDGPVAFIRKPPKEKEKSMFCACKRIHLVAHPLPSPSKTKHKN